MLSGGLSLGHIGWRRGYGAGSVNPNSLTRGRGILGNEYADGPRGEWSNRPQQLTPSRLS